MKPAGPILALLLCMPAPLSCTRATPATEVPASAASMVVSLRGIDCSSCGDQVVEALTQRPGVYTASFDKVRAEVSLQYDAEVVAPKDVLAIVAQLGHEGVEGAGQGEYLPEVEFPAELDVQKVSKAGEAVALRSHLAAGKVTVFDFYAVWCKPCRQIDHHMKQVLAAHEDVALRKIDVVDWDSEAAQQHLRGVPDLPYVIVYGPSGKQVATISGLKLEALDEAIEKARGK